MTFIYPFQQPVHPLAIQVCRTLGQAGFQAYIVGGCVRDLHLRLAPKDWDITTDASPEKIMELFPRTIPTGLQHGTVTVCMAEGVENHFEVTTFRVEGEYLDGRRPESVKFVKSITEDLARRDFTINAMAFDPVDNVGIDPFGGEYDLKNGLIRAVGNADARFQEDGLRIMRAARFAARFDFKVEPSTFHGMVNNRDTLQKVSRERISDEFSKLLMTNNPCVGLQLLDQAHLMSEICPEWYRDSDPEQAYYLIQGFSAVGELETRLAQFYVHSYHPLSREIVVEKDLTNLKFSNKEIKRVLFLLETLHKSYQLYLNQSVAHYKQFMARIKNESPDHWEDTLKQFILLLQSTGQEDLTDLICVKYSGETVHSRKAMQINGDDLLKLGIKPGPQIRELLDACYQEILEHPEHNSKEYLLQLILRS